MDPNHYRFRGVWRLAAPPAAVFAALADVPGYPRWWPEIRAVRETGPDSGEVLVRALLPYRLVIGLTAVRRDRAAGVLEARMDGDLTGWSRWTVAADGTGGALVLFEEDTRPAKPLLRRLALPARPLFRANHAVMMRRGRRGLAAHLAAHPAGPSAGPSAAPSVPRPAARAAARPAPGSTLPED
ncbi:SRPBCC family protein [Kitasatospora misakiensis]|uniref:SRPBCC family protein n=1 Tax=Kitasatospora misakiensis TaxID=67330 RepID=A0ABW0XCM9_9ACTN